MVVGLSPTNISAHKVIKVWFCSSKVKLKRPFIRLSGASNNVTRRKYKVELEMKHVLQVDLQTTRSFTGRRKAVVGLRVNFGKF